MLAHGSVLLRRLDFRSCFVFIYSVLFCSVLSDFCVVIRRGDAKKRIVRVLARYGYAGVVTTTDSLINKEIK